MEFPDFSEIFHQSSKDHLKNHPFVSANPAEWPDEWKTTYYKTYPRLPKILLDDDPFKTDFFDVLKKRKSQRNFSSVPITKKEISLLLKYSCGNIGPSKNGRERRAQPSGGARFPLEVYPLIFRSSEDLLSGVYHYGVKNHSLDVLEKKDFSATDISTFFTYPWMKDASLAFVITAVFQRNQNKYGERGYRYILHEAGHIAQNMYLIAAALNLKCCALGGTWDENLEKLIDIDGVTESVVYAIAVGK